MESFINIFNDREKAVIFWVVLVLILMLVNSDVRKSLSYLFASLIKPQILIPLFLMISYVGLIVLLLSRVQLWVIPMLKDTVIWFLIVGSVMFVNYDEANKNRAYFRRKILGVFGAIAILEFIVNLYTLPFWIEFLLIIPGIFIITILLAYSSTKKEYILVKKVMEWVLAVVVFWLVIFTLINIVKGFQDFATVKNLKDFLLPVWLTIATLPFIYLLALYGSYEELFIRLDLLMKVDKGTINYTKWKMFTACLMNLKRLNAASKELPAKLMYVSNKPEVMKLMERFNDNNRRG